MTKFSPQANSILFKLANKLGEGENFVKVAATLLNCTQRQVRNRYYNCVKDFQDTSWLPEEKNY